MKLRRSQDDLSAITFILVILVLSIASCCHQGATCVCAERAAPLSPESHASQSCLPVCCCSGGFWDMCGEGGGLFGASMCSSSEPTVFILHTQCSAADREASWLFTLYACLRCMHAPVLMWDWVMPCRLQHMTPHPSTSAVNGLSHCQAAGSRVT